MNPDDFDQPTPLTSVGESARKNQMIEMREFWEEMGKAHSAFNAALGQFLSGDRKTRLELITEGGAPPFAPNSVYSRNEIAGLPRDVLSL